MLHIVTVTSGQKSVRPDSGEGRFPVCCGNLRELIRFLKRQHDPSQGVMRDRGDVMSVEQSDVTLEQEIKRLKMRVEHLEHQLNSLHYLAVAVRNSSDAITVHDFDGNIKRWNKGARKMYGWTEEQALTMNIHQVVPPSKSEEMLKLIRDIAQGKERGSFETKRLTADGRILDVWTTATVLVDERNQPIGVATVDRDVSSRKQAEREKNELILELQKINTELKKAIAETKTLRGILPICMICKQIRNDKGYWEQVEVYVHNHSEAAFSHGICPSCLKRKYPKVYEKNKLLSAPEQREMLEA